MCRTDKKPTQILMLGEDSNRADQRCAKSPTVLSAINLPFSTQSNSTNIGSFVGTANTSGAANQFHITANPSV